MKIKSNQAKIRVLTLDYDKLCPLKNRASEVSLTYLLCSSQTKLFKPPHLSHMNLGLNHDIWVQPLSIPRTVT